MFIQRHSLIIFAALFNVHVLFPSLYKIYILIIIQNIDIMIFCKISILYRNWNADIESSLIYSIFILEKVFDSDF